MTRNVNVETENLIKLKEGLRLSPYLCQAGRPTIGYGATYYPKWYRGGAKVTMSDPPISADLAIRFLRDLLDEYEDGVASRLRQPANDNEFGAMVSLAYNIGLGGFYQSSVLRLFNAGNKPAAARAFLMWNQFVDPADGVQKESPGLTVRRRQEMALFTKPVPAQIPAVRLEDVVPPPPAPLPAVEMPPDLPIPQDVASTEKGAVRTALESKSVMTGAGGAVVAAGSLAANLNTFVDTSSTVQMAVSTGAANISVAKSLHEQLGWMGISMIGLGVVTVVCVFLAVRAYLKIRNMEAISK